MSGKPSPHNPHNDTEMLLRHRARGLREEGYTPKFVYPLEKAADEIRAMKADLFSARQALLTEGMKYDQLQRAVHFCAYWRLRVGAASNDDSGWSAWAETNMVPTEHAAALKAAIEAS